jgi:hypothetical protein
MKELTESDVIRQNVLNNNYALEKIESDLRLGGIHWEEEQIFTKTQVAEILKIDERTIDRYIEKHASELSRNGYKILKGEPLRKLKKLFGDDMNVVTKTTILGVFSFKTVLNLAMLVTESEMAKVIRSRILDIVLDVVTEKTGGHTKFINQRDEDFLPSALKENSYRKEFTDALNNYLEMGVQKYAIYTNRIYQIVFLENASEYKKILKLASRDKVRETFYAEVLNAIASFEHGLSVEMENAFNKKGSRLYPKELDELIEIASKNPYLHPFIEDARIKMASRDLGFRDALHQKLEKYLRSVPEEDFDRFLGEASKSLEERLSEPETLEVFKRLKNR